MAIDSALKRRSAAGILNGLPVNVISDATKSASWRQQVGYGYVGIVASDVIIDVSNGIKVLFTALDRDILTLRAAKDLLLTSRDLNALLTSYR